MTPKVILIWLDKNIEKLVISTSFAVLAGIIVMGVIQRFAFSYQSPWSSSIPVYLFLWIIWIGAAYNVRTRTQLRFDEFRNRLPYKGQFICLLTDTALWIGISVIVIYYSVQQTQLVHQNFAVVQGTDNIQQWWFYLATPIGWSLVIYRSLQNLIEDVRRFGRGEPLNSESNIFTAD